MRSSAGVAFLFVIQTAEMIAFIVLSDAEATALIVAVTAKDA